MKKKPMKSELEILQDLNSIVLREIGLDLDHQYNIVDQDTGVQLQINGKLIKYYFGSEISPDSNINGDKIFDAVRDSYLMNFLVAYYIEKVKEEYPELYIYSYHSINDKHSPRTALEFKGNLNVRTRFYYNDCLKYIEGLYRLTGCDIDLTEYDMMIAEYDSINGVKRK